MHDRPPTHHGLVLTAAGGSTRFGAERSKVLESFGDASVLVAAARPFLDAIDDLDVVVTCREEDRAGVAAALAAEPRLSHARLVRGGATRQASVKAGLEALAPSVRWVLVHDAARPCASAALIARVLDAARRHGAAVPALPVVDTIHRVDERGCIVESLPRGALRAVQTPQVARRDALVRAYAHAERFAIEATDEAGLLTAAGIEVATVDGDPANEKITTRADLERLAAGG